MADQNTNSTNQRMNCAIRIINLITGGLLIGFGIAGIIIMAISNLLALRFFLVFSPVFMVLFGMLVLAAECKIEFITTRITFFNSLVGRGIFNIYLSSSVFYYFSCGSNGTQWVGWLAASLIFAVGIIYLILACCGKKTGYQQSQAKQQMM